MERFVAAAKNLLMQNVTEQLQQFYGIWADGHTIPVEQLPSQDTDRQHTARMLRDRIAHLMAALPDDATNKERDAVGQLIAEQAFTQLNRFCAVRMCEERQLILESVHNGYDAEGFLSYDAIAAQVPAPRFERYRWYLLSVFDELSIELPAVFDRFSPYGLVFPDETTLLQLIDLINDTQLSEWYDESRGETVNFWREDETLGWMFQDYNSLEERRKMRDESNKPRNSREMAVRNQFFTPEYVVRFLVDNSLGRIWYEMTGGQSSIANDQCRYMVCRPDEPLAERVLKEPTEILSLDPTCGSMHFGLYLYEVYEYIYMDAWDNQPSLLTRYREVHTRESFRREVPRLILENNIYGCEIDPRALQIAALSLWLRAQRSYDEQNIHPADRPLITKSNLVLAEAMPGNKRMLKSLMEELDKPMQKLLKKIWEKMRYVGEAGLLFKMEKEIDDEIAELRQKWNVVNQDRYATLFDSEERREHIMEANKARQALRRNKEAFFSQITERLKSALAQLSEKLTEEEGYENALFSDDATRGFAFIELCQRRFDCIVMNPPFGEGSENTSDYLDQNYPAWCRNLVCAFFDRMQEMLDDGGCLGAIFDRTVMIKSSYEPFRRRNLCGFIANCADTGWGVLDASVETSTLVVNKLSSDIEGAFMDVLDINADEKADQLHALIAACNNGEKVKWNYFAKSSEFGNLPNSVVGYDWNTAILELFQFKNIESHNFIARKGTDFVASKHPRLFFEISQTEKYAHYYNGGAYSLIYKPYRDVVFWSEDIIKADPQTNIRNIPYQLSPGVGFGKRGELVDAHIVKANAFFTSEGIAITRIGKSNSLVVCSFINSVLSQSTINIFCGEHKQAGYMNLLPMPDYATRRSDIERIVNEIIDIKRWWFSLDETNLEYHGLTAQLGITGTVGEALDALQSRLTADYERYTALVRDNDDLWMDLAGIDRDSEFRQTLNDYKSRRPYEELLSIDGASHDNRIDRSVLAQEMVMELVGMAFGRWDTAYARGTKALPEFGGVFDALPFMPVVSREATATDGLAIPDDGILSNQADAALCLTAKVRDVMHHIWGTQADDREYELCQLIGCQSLHDYLSQPTGFMDYHFRRYTKSRRKAPIYWFLTSADGSVGYWVYYPRLGKDTLPKLQLLLRSEQEHLRSRLNDALAAKDKVAESDVRARQEQVEGMQDELARICAAGYVPCHDDGVPVTAAPLLNLAAHKGWRDECKKNMKALEDGDYDWSHLAMSLYPARVTQKAKKDWCLALTHGLEHLCINKPKEKKPRGRKKAEPEQGTLFD